MIPVCDVKLGIFSFICCFDDSLMVLNWPERFNTRAVLILKLQYLILLCNSFSAAETAFQSVVTENLGAAIINLALVGF